MCKVAVGLLAALMCVVGEELRAEALPQSLQRQVLAVLGGPGPFGPKYCDSPVKEVPSEAVRTIDFNDDGVPDYVIEVGSYCMGCPNGGCIHQVWISQATGWFKAYEGGIRGVEGAARRKGRNVLLIHMHGGFCGGFGADECRMQLRWNGRAIVEERR
jgi:hypothetical protein